MLSNMIEILIKEKFSLLFSFIFSEESRWHHNCLQSSGFNYHMYVHDKKSSSYVYS